MRFTAAVGLCVALGGCGAGLVPVVTTIGAIAGTIGTTEQLGITGIGDYMALRKPATCIPASPASAP
jgi:hypothetical protein